MHVSCEHIESSHDDQQEQLDKSKDFVKCLILNIWLGFLKVRPLHKPDSL
jgi:hypothetical protein